jgi:hypothetical protein
MDCPLQPKTGCSRNVKKSSTTSVLLLRRSWSKVVSIGHSTLFHSCPPSDSLPFRSFPLFFFFSSSSRFKLLLLPFFSPPPLAPSFLPLLFSFVFSLLHSFASSSFAPTFFYTHFPPAAPAFILIFHFNLWSDPPLRASLLKSRSTVVLDSAEIMHLVQYLTIAAFSRFFTLPLLCIPIFWHLSSSAPALARF